MRREIMYDGDVLSPDLREREPLVRRMSLIMSGSAR